MSNQKVSVLIADYKYFGDVNHFKHECNGFLDAGIDVHFGTCTTEEDIIRQGQKFDAILLCGNPPMGEKAFENLPECKVVLRYGVGYDSINIEEATKYGKLVLYMPGYCYEELATHAAGFILALNRNMVIHDRMIRKGKWDALAGYKIRQLSGLTLGLFGFGRSGKELANIFFSGWGMKIIAYDPYASIEDAKKQNVELVTFDSLLKESDIISIHAPLTKDTYHTFSENEFEKMKPTSMIVNTSRGQLIDQKALTKALQKGQILAAGLDVFEREPLEKDDPLLSMDNVVLTPHSAYYSEDSVNRQHEIAVKTVIEALKGQIPYNIANPQIVKNLVNHY